MRKLKTTVLAFIKAKAKEEGFTLQVDEHYMAQRKGKDFSSGYFDYPESDKRLKKPKLAIGIKGKPIREWVETLLHEYCHFQQYKARRKDGVWKNYISSHKKYGMESKEYHLAAVKLEQDCEKRTIKLIKKLKLEEYINVKEYAQRANSYLTFYHVYSKTQKWYQKAPYSVEEIVKKMPKKIGSWTSLTPTPAMVGLYIKHCYKHDYSKGDI